MVDMSVLRSRAATLAKKVDISAEWYRGKTFSADWSNSRVYLWPSLLEPFRHSTRKVLEVGAYEGRSAIYWLNFFPRAEVTCIDIFPGTTEQRFDANTAEFGVRLRKIRERSSRALTDLREEEFDLIYIDGAHERDAVMVDCLLAWRLLAPGGIMILDDYGMAPGEFTWTEVRGDASIPRTAIDTFLAWHANSQQLLHRDYQVAIQKRP